MKQPEFIRINLKEIPDKIIKECKLKNIATANGSIYIYADRGMYRLPQNGLLANEMLENRLNKRGYHQSKLVSGLWSQKMAPSIVYTNSGQFWSAVRGRRTRTTSQRNTRESLQGDYIMGWQKIHLNYIGLVPRATSSSSFSARVH